MSIPSVPKISSPASNFNTLTRVLNAIPMPESDQYDVAAVEDTSHVAQNVFNSEQNQKTGWARSSSTAR